MRRILFALPALFALLVTPAHLSAKGNTIRITIKGGDLAGPIEITDPGVAARFHVWSGPGTSSNEAQGLIVDWSRGMATPPKNVPVYEIWFLTTRPDHSNYRVSYVVDPFTDEGYVYLPGKADERYLDNVWLIYRGREGEWFHAWDEWKTLAHPLIAKAQKK